MKSPLLSRPAPDFAALDRVIRGSELPRRVHIAELLINDPVLQAITERFTDDPWIPQSKATAEAYQAQIVSLYHRLGYDFVPVFPAYHNLPTLDRLVSADGSELPLGQQGREWIDEGHGLIADWQDFDRFPWDDIKPDYRPLETTTKLLPDGMKMTVMATVFQQVQHSLLGVEGLSYLLYDDPDLVAAVFERWGQIVFDLYEAIMGMEEVGALWHGDDLGFTTSTMISPRALRQHVMPWFKRFGELAHAHGKTYWLHCCGNVYATGIVDDLIDPIHLDAFHSFQDPILPIAEFQKTYGDRLTGMGGCARPWR